MKPILNPLPSLTDASEREKAIQELDRNIVVMAGAGTGKTKILIDRIALLIVGRGFPVERIVALTFTKKAAEEMRERLELFLRDVINDPGSFAALKSQPEGHPDVWRVRAERALQDIPRAQIGTIHSFASYLLHLYPLQAQVDPHFREDEGEILEDVFESEWSKWIHQELGGPTKEESDWRGVLTHVELENLKVFSQALVNPMISWDRLKNKPSLNKIMARHAQTLQDLLEKYPLSPKATAFKDGLEAMERVFNSKKHVPVDQAADLELIKKVSGRHLPKEWTQISGLKETVSDLKQVALAVGLVDADLVDRVIQLIKPMVMRARSELARKGAISFDGLLVQARDLLEKNTDVRRALKNQFDAFLVDEFQDTDPLQGEILFYLAETLGEESAHWKEIKLGPGRLFVVGDPKQSIYRFRGADMAAFQEFGDLMIKGGALQLTLSSNFRSVPDVIEAVNTIFSQLMVSEKYVQPPYSPLVPVREPQLNPACEVIFLKKPLEGPKPKAEVARFWEAHMIADWIQAHVLSESSPYQLKDVVLLFRSSNAFGPYLDVFKQRGLRYLAEGEKHFYKTAEIMELTNLLSAIADPHDSLALVGVLRSPLGGLTDTEILELKNQKRLSYLHLPSSDKAPVASLYRTLMELNQRSKLIPVKDFLEEVFEKTRLLEILLEGSHGEQARANVLKIQQLAQKWGELGPMTLTNFVTRLKNNQDVEREEGENPLADSQFDAIRIMTIHKAKGLEFPIVFLPNMSAGIRPAFSSGNITERDWQTGLTGLRIPGAGSTNAAMVNIEAQGRKKDAAEEIRVFYVAATRARDRFIMLFREDASLSSEFVPFLKRAHAWPDSDHELAWGQAKVKIHPVMFQEKDVLRAKSKEKKLGETWSPEKLIDGSKNWDKKVEQLKQFKPFQSPSQLMKEAEKMKIQEDVGRSGTKAILTGILVHKVLELWEFVLFKKSHEFNLDQLIHKASMLLGLDKDQEESALIISQSQSMLREFFNSEAYKKLCSVKILGREIPFLYPIANDGQTTVMQGFIDLLYEDEGKLVVADYKTSTVNDKDIMERAQKYQLQGKVYQEAVSRVLGPPAEFEIIFVMNGRSIRMGHF